MCATPNIASAFPPPSRAPWKPSTGSGPRSARTSASASSASSGATPATRRFIPPTSLPCAAAFPKYKFNLHNLIELLMNDKHVNPSNYALVILSEGARVGRLPGARIRRGGRLRTPQEGQRGRRPERRDQEATGEETMVSDLTYDLRSGSPDFVDKMVASTFAGMAMDCIEEGRARPDDGDRAWLLRRGADSRSEARAAQGGRRHHVQYRPLPARLFRKAGSANLHDARVTPYLTARSRRRLTVGGRIRAGKFRSQNGGQLE